MATISIKREHHLSADEVREHVEELAQKLAQELEASYQWDGDVLRFKRTGASGVIEIRDNELWVEVELSMMLRPFKSKIERSINDYLDESIA